MNCKRHVLLIGRPKVIQKVLLSQGIDVSIFLRAEDKNQVDWSLPFKNIYIGSESLSLVESLAQFCRINKIDSIVCIHDEYQGLAIDLSSALGQDFNMVSRDTLEKTTNKIFMRQALHQAGIDTNLITEQVNSLEACLSIVKMASKNDFFILKPVSGSGSRSIYKVQVDDFHPLSPVIQALDFSQENYLMETFIAGKEYSVECFSYNGRHKVMCVTEKKKDEMHFVEIGHTVPAPMVTGMREAIEAHVINVLETVGICQGASHTEIIVTDDGQINTIETHTRAGGDGIIDLIGFACGIDVNELIIKHALGEDIWNQIPTSDDFHCVAVARFQTYQGESGMVTDIEGLEAVKNHPNVKAMIPFITVGDKISKTNNSWNRTSLLMLQHDSYDEANQLADELIEKVKIIVCC
jgi:hypothetical protein